MNGNSTIGRLQRLGLNLVGTAGCIAIIYGFSHLSFHPIQKAKLELRSQHQQVENLRADIPKKEVEITEIRAEIDSKRKSVEKLEDLQIESDGVYQLLLKDYAGLLDKTKVELISFVPVGSSSNEFGPTSFRVEIQGSYRQVCQFVLELSQVERLQTITSLSVTPYEANRSSYTATLEIDVSRSVNRPQT